MTDVGLTSAITRATESANLTGRIVATRTSWADRGATQATTGPKKWGVG